MTRTIDRLVLLRVSDVMNRNVLQLSANSSMAQAAMLMLKNQVSGAPVVDEANRCIGILSASDFMQREHAQNAGGQAPEPAKTGDIDADSVQQHMSCPVKSVAASAAITEAAQVMCDTHVHRLPVLDSDGRLLGIISSLDIVAAVMNTVEELKS